MNWRVMYLVGLGVGLYIAHANAQQAIPHFHNGGGIYVSPVNCDVLKGTSEVCISNVSDFDITAINCEGWLDHPQQLPGGQIDSGTIAIVNFGARACKKDIEVTWSNHDKQSFPSKNVYDLTTWAIKGPRKSKGEKDE
jgi:hypothetical protein